MNIRSKIFFVALIGLLATSLSAYAVTLRFWDNGVLVHTATETDNRGSMPITSYYDESAMKAAGHLAECEGYEFAGWKTASPIVNEAVYASDAAAGKVTSVTIGTADIDLYAIYRKNVKYFSRVNSLNDAKVIANYMIVGYSGGTYAAMGMSNVITNKTQSAVYGKVVTPCDSKFYNVVDSLIWKVTNVSGNSVVYRNAGNDKYLYFYYDSYYEYLCYSSSTYISLTFAGASNTFKLSRSVDNGWRSRTAYLYYTPSTGSYFGSAISNAFVIAASSVSSETEWFSGTNALYLYREYIESRYKSKCGPYTLQFKACGDNTCGDDFTVSPTSLTESQTSTACTALAQFGGVNPTSVSPTIGCTSLWDFAGWATTPCADKTVDAPTYITSTAYPLYHQNDTLYAVYRHKTNGTPDYYSSYPGCERYTVTFYPCNGLVNSSSAAYPVTEASSGSGITTPTASFTTCGGWTFAGWATSPCVDAAAVPGGLVAASTTYYPSSAGEKFYAVYTNSTRWTSYPICDAATVTLYAGTGTVEGESSVNKPEASAGAGITLPSAEMSCPDVWSFRGWTTSIIGMISEEPTLYSGTFHPRSANDALYAVYRRGTNPYVYAHTPSCDPLEVVLHACGTDGCDATVNSKLIDTIPESSIGEGITFPAATITCTDRWEFAGWSATPISHRYTTPDDLFDEGDDYTPTRNYENFYAVYKHATMNYWTSHPDCTPYTIHLHACEGTLSGGASDVDSTEVSAGRGILLPTITPLCAARGWSFRGWVEGGDLGTTEDISDLNIHEGGERYTPIRDNVHLYAVFQIRGYKQVIATSELTTTDEYIIAFYWNYGTAYSYENFALSNTYEDKGSWFSHKYYVNLTPIEGYADADGNRYITDPASGNACKWKLESDGNNGWFFRNVADNSLYVGSYDDALGLWVAESSYRAAYIINLEQYCIEKKSYTDDYRYWHFINEGVGSVANPSFFAYQDDNPDRCYLYRYTGTVYSSWPHCAEYTVKFDGCDGMATSASVDETDAGKGVQVPGVTNTCEGWAFAGWAAAPYDEKTGSLTQNLYPEGSTYVPHKNDETLYAVYTQVKDTFEQVSGMSDLYTGVNYLIVWNSSRAMGNDYFEETYEWGMNTEAVSVATNKIITQNAALKWQLQGYSNNYIWYNSDANKYLDCSHTHYDPYYSTPGYYTAASLTDTKDDNYTISYVSSNGGYFTISSNASRTYLVYVGNASSNRYFDAYTYDPGNASIKFYRQKADYWSYPCSMPAEPMRWGEGEFIVESLVHSGAPTAASSRITDITEGEHGCYVVSYNSEAGRKLRIGWGGHYYRFTVPFVASESNTPAVEIQPTQHLVVLPNATFTVGLKTRLRQVSVYENAELVIADGDTLFVDTLILRSKGADQHPSIVFGGTTSGLVVNSNIIYHDLRIDDQAYYPFSVPFDVDASQIRYSGLISNTALPVPTRGTNDDDYGDYHFWVKYYDGVTRAAHANAGAAMWETYWRHIPNNTIRGCLGYSIGIADHTVGNHIERTLRFPIDMTDYADWNKYEDGTEVAEAEIQPSQVTDATRKNHAGWNYIGNPYFRIYYPGLPDDGHGLLTGHYELDDKGEWRISQDGTQTVPYFTYYDVASNDYYQTRTGLAGTSIKPFSAVFIQVEEDNGLIFANPISTDWADPTPAPAWRRVKKQETPIVETGLLFAPVSVNNKDGRRSERDFDEAGLIISNRYTADYEVGADLVKMFNSKGLHIYTMNATHSLAFNAMDEQSAAQTIPVGVSVPSAGSYTFSFDDRQYDPAALEALYLTDYESHQTTNLLDNDYTCTIASGKYEGRFALNAVLKAKNVPTDAELVLTDENTNIITNADGSITIYSNDVLTGVIVYDVAGRLIGQWSPNAYQWTLDLPQGVYAISLQCESHVSHAKICTK